MPPNKKPHSFELHFQHVNWLDEKETIRAIRQEVFINEQGVSQEEEWDGEDERETTHHFLAYADGKAIATSRLLKYQHIGRVCVLSPYRGMGAGLGITKQTISYALPHNSTSTFILNSQTTAIGLYEKLGFIAEEEEFLDAGIPHKKMQLTIKEQSDLETFFGQRVIRFSSRDAFLTHLNTVTRFARREMLIFIQNLPHETLNKRDWISLVSAFVRSNRYAQIKILAQDTKPFRGRRHQLIELAKRLPSKVLIRQCLIDEIKHQTSYILTDESQIIYCNSDEQFSGFANYQARAEVHSIKQEFNYLWQSHSQPDRELEELNG